MEYSVKFVQVQNYFKSGLWNEAMIENAVGKWITEQEMNEIIGKNT